VCYPSTRSGPGKRAGHTREKIKYGRKANTESGSSSLMRQGRCLIGGQQQVFEGGVSMPQASQGPDPFALSVTDRWGCEVWPSCWYISQTKRRATGYDGHVFVCGTGVRVSFPPSLLCPPPMLPVWSCSRLGTLVLAPSHCRPTTSHLRLHIPTPATSGPLRACQATSEPQNFDDQITKIGQRTSSGRPVKINVAGDAERVKK